MSKKPSPDYVKWGKAGGRTGGRGVKANGTVVVTTFKKDDSKSEDRCMLAQVKHHARENWSPTAI